MVTPYLIVNGAAKAIAWYKKVLGASEVYPAMKSPDGKVMHAEIRIGDSVVMLADECPAFGAFAPAPGARCPVSLLVYVENVDRTFPRAIAAGATEIRAVADQFYGDRSGVLTDPFGHMWAVATHKEDVSPKELERRAAALHKG